MYASKPMKQAKMEGQTQVTRTESVDLLTPLDSAQERDLPTTIPLSASNQKMKELPPLHPKGHKSHDIAEIWKSLDSQPYLRLTDTSALMDVWVQPISVEGISSVTCNVTFIEIVLGQHLKYRTAQHKMSIDDICKVLYLSQCLNWDVEGQPRLTYDDWIADVTTCFIKACGVEESSNRAKLCDYLIKENKDFTFYPGCMKNCGIFIRKTCVHSYKSEDIKLENPAVLKSCAVKGKFEYIFEARFVPVPIGWWDLPINGK